jgi:hypothetical protein
MRANSLLNRLDILKQWGFYLVLGLSLGCAVGGLIIGGSHALSLRSSVPLVPWNGYPMNVVDWFGVMPPLVAKMETPASSAGVGAPSFKLLGTSLFSDLPTGHWALLSSEQADGMAKWVQEGESYGIYRLNRIQARSVELVAQEGEGHWTLSLGSDTGQVSETEKQDCTSAIRVPRMAMDVLNQQQAILLQGVEPIPDGKGIRVKPELAALLGGLGFMAGDMIINVNHQPLNEPRALLALVVNPLLQGRNLTIKGIRGTQEKQWHLVNEAACK